MFYLEEQQLLLIFYQQFLIFRDTIVLWIRGGFSINNATLNRFFSLHFISPLLILFIVILHLFALHLTGSSNPLGSNFNNYKISFHPYFLIKDLLEFYIILFIFIFINFQFPYHLGDPDNFKIANAINTPTLQYIFLVNIKLTSLC